MESVRKPKGYSSTSIHALKIVFNNSKGLIPVMLAAAVFGPQWLGKVIKL